MITKGRRSDINANAFWAAATALVPDDVFENRQGRAVMRLLNLNYRAVKKASDFRREMHDTGRGWKYIHTAPHQDRVDWTPLDRWWHGDDASTVDNDNKQLVRVCKGLTEDGKAQTYELHDRRYACETQSELLKVLRGSSEFGEMAKIHLERQISLRRKRARFISQSAVRMSKLEEDVNRLRRAREAEGAMEDDAGAAAEEGGTGAAARTGAAVVAALQTPSLAEASAFTMLGHKYKEEEGLRRAKKKVLKKNEVRREPMPAEIAVEVDAAPEYSELIVSPKQFLKSRCKCIVNRQGTECDCQLCTYINHNTALWHRARSKWRKPVPGGVPCTLPQCKCSDPVFQAASRSVRSLVNFVLCPPLSDEEVNGPRDPAMPWSLSSPRWQTPASAKKPFSCHAETCLEGTHMTPGLLSTTRVCGWAAKTSPSCMVECSDAPFWWKRWEPRETGRNRETGQSAMTMEFSPVSGTRKEFMAEFGAKLELYMPHIHLVRLSRVNLKLQTEFMQTPEQMANPTVALSVSDYAAQHETPREFTGTCCSKEKHNDCVTCIGYKPYNHVINRKAWGKRRKDQNIEVVKQHCDVFYGMFSAGHKASAHHYNMQRQDIEHFIKFGTTIHGEWFMNGERLPRVDGKQHKAQLPTGNQPSRSGNEDGDPWTLRDTAIKPPDFPEMEQHIESTDGCAAQFQGEANIGEVARAAVGLTAVIRHSVIGVSAHGKNIGDGLGNKVKDRLAQGVMNGRLVETGTRNHVLYLAQHHPAPKLDDGMKDGLWTPQRIFYGFYDDELMSKKHAHFKPYSPSKCYHCRVGPCKSLDTVMKSGPIVARKCFCACPSCRVGGALVGDYKNCKVMKITGRAVPKRCPPVVPVQGAQTATGALTEFTATLSPRSIYACRVGQDDKGIEGPFWLCRVLRPPYACLEDTLHCGQLFRKGFLLVDINWLSFHKNGREGSRVYKVLPARQLVSTASILRIGSVKLSQAGDTFVLSEQEQKRISDSSL